MGCGDCPGCPAGQTRRRILAGLLSLPLFVGVWFWITLGATPPRYVYFYLAGGVGAYLLASSIGWILAAFAGEDD